MAQLTPGRCNDAASATAIKWQPAGTVRHLLSRMLHVAHMATVESTTGSKGGESGLSAAEAEAQGRHIAKLVLNRRTLLNRLHRQGLLLETTVAGVTFEGRQVRVMQKAIGQQWRVGPGRQQSPAHGFVAQWCRTPMQA
jgi:hypothetical protein